MKNCERCGAQIDDWKHFCPICGSPQSQTAQPQSAQPQQPQYTQPQQPQYTQPQQPQYTQPQQPQYTQPQQPQYTQPQQPQYTQPAGTPKKKSKAVPVVIVVLSLLLAAAVAAGIWIYIENSKETPSADTAEEVRPTERFSFVYKGVLYTPGNLSDTMTSSNDWKTLTSDDQHGRALYGWNDYIAGNNTGEIVLVNGDLRVRLRYYNYASDRMLISKCNLCGINICHNDWDQLPAPPALPDGFVFWKDITGRSNASDIESAFGKPDDKHFATIQATRTYYYGDASALSFVTYEAVLGEIDVGLPGD